jgi:site-specific recombinase XerD
MTARSDSLSPYPGGRRCAELYTNIDLSRSLLIIRGTKFGKSRFVPFGPQMATRLTGYLALRQQSPGIPSPESPAFSFTTGQSIHPAQQRASSSIPWN